MIFFSVIPALHQVQDELQLVSLPPFCHTSESWYPALVSELKYPSSQIISHSNIERTVSFARQDIDVVSSHTYTFPFVMLAKASIQVLHPDMDSVSSTG
jgi:hypothetical protein